MWDLRTRVSITPNIVTSPAIGKQFSVNVDIIEGANVGGYQFEVVFDNTALRYVDSVNGDYLPSGTFFLPHALIGYKHPFSSVRIGATSLAGVSNGDGTLATLTFEVVDVTKSTLYLGNVIFTDSDGEHLPFLGGSSKIVVPPVAPLSAIISITPGPEVSAAIGEEITFSIDITGGENIKEYTIGLRYNEAALRYLSFENGNYLDNVSLWDDDGSVTLRAISRRVGNGDGTLATVTFEVLEPEPTQTSTVNTSSVYIGRAFFRGGDGLWYYIPTTVPIYDDSGQRIGGTLLDNTIVDVRITAPLFGDVNSDGVVNILDLVLVASSFGKSVQLVLVDGQLFAVGDAGILLPAERDPADVNEDGIVNIVDLVKIAGAIGVGEAAAPSSHPQTLEILTVTDVRQWLRQAQHVNLTDATSQRGILFLEKLLEALIPKETQLLANYPNPFNPETWIPYQLAEAGEVEIVIYDMRGIAIRRLPLGHRSAGFYAGKERAAYWDGKNALGEPVASGVYFYTLTADNFTATRKMLILK